VFTLAYNGQEKSFSDWGIRADFALEFQSKGKSSATLTTTEAFDSATPQFAWKQPVTIWQGRTAVGAGGSVWFAGFVGPISRIADGPDQGIQYRLFDIWWLLEREILRQPRMYISNLGPQGQKTFGIWFLSEIYLGQTVNLAGQFVALQTNGQQIVEILQWFNEVYNPTRRGNTYLNPGAVDATQDWVQWGAIDPQVKIPYSRAQTIFCAEAIINMLRWSPSVTIARDYTQRPVRLSFIDQNAASRQLADIVINITSAQEREIKCAPQNERQLPGVVIHYKKAIVTNGVQEWAYQTDAWPPGASDFTPEACTQFIELAGSTVNIVTSNVVTGPISDSTQMSWWTQRDKSLKDPKIGSLAFSADNVFTILDDSGNPINTALFPNELLSSGGPIYNWMGVNVIEANVSCMVGYEHFDDTAQTAQTRKVNSRRITVRVKLTNAATQSYQATTHFDPGEQFPAMGAGGLANQIYNGLSQLQFAGRISLVAGQLDSLAITQILPGARLKLVGPNNTYSNLCVQSVSARPHLGALDVQFGPAARLDAADLIELARASRWRFIYEMPSGRDTGQPSPASQVDLSTSAAPKENTMHGLDSSQYHAVIYTPPP